MLLDLNKEIMNELGVTVVGDIIAILKHAKVVHRQVGVPPSPWVPRSRGRWRGPSRASRRRLGSKSRQTRVLRLVVPFAV